MEKKAKHSLEMCSSFLSQKVFDREDYLELVQLTVLYLGGEVPGFRFQYPGAFHHARWMAKLIYYLNLALLIRSCNFLTEGEQEEVEMMAQYILVFHSVWWLQCYLSTSAPRLYLTAISNMRMYILHNPMVTSVCL